MAKNNSIELAKVLEIEHKELIKFYWYLENQIVKRRHLIKCTIVINEGGENYLQDISDAFKLAAFIKFGKQNSLAINNF